MTEKNEEARLITFEKDINIHAEGSCLVSFGNTKVICTASFDSRVPRFLRNTGKGWLTASYSMLPRSTGSRIKREIEQGKPSGRTQEIQRLIGRSLRASLDLSKLGENQIFIDCDVIQADGGTRTAAISGAYVALELCINKLMLTKKISNNPIKHQVAAISCGIKDGISLVDLDYIEDSNIDVDSNFIFNSQERIIEIQGSAEHKSFSKEEMLQMYDFSLNSCKEIFKLQKEVINK